MIGRLIHATERGHRLIHQLDEVGIEVANRIPFPTWYSRRGVVRPGAANPLGTRWIGLSKAGYGIHGTNAPESIGRAASHGCVRMRNRDVEELFALIGVGTLVEVVAN